MEFCAVAEPATDPHLEIAVRELDRRAHMFGRIDVIMALDAIADVRGERSIREATSILMALKKII